MYGNPVTPSKSRFQSKTYLVNLAIVVLAGAELKLRFLQPLLPVNVFMLLSFLLPFVNFILRENTDRAVGLDAPGVSFSNRVATVVLALFAVALLAVLLLSSPQTRAAEADATAETRYCGEPRRDAAGDIYRSTKVRTAFQKAHPCPATCQPAGACPGWQVDHVIPLACGGCDAVSNLQWLPESIKVMKGGKDGFERRIYGGYINAAACHAPPVQAP